jgi:hypothetical protein
VAPLTALAFSETEFPAQAVPLFDAETVHWGRQDAGAVMF